MKKIICLILSVSLLCFVGCSGKDTSSPDNGADGGIDAIALSGKLDGIQYGLGSDIDEVKKHYKDVYEQFQQDVQGEGLHINDGFEPYYSVQKKDGYTEIDVSAARFYYQNDKEDKGILAIATDAQTFGFIPGTTTKYEVEDAIKAEGKTLNATDDDMCFMAAATESVIILRYEFENYRLDFFFYDNALVTTAIIDAINW